MRNPGSAWELSEASGVYARVIVNGHAASSQLHGPAQKQIKSG